MQSYINSFDIRNAKASSGVSNCDCVKVTLGAKTNTHSTAKAVSNAIVEYAKV